VSSDVTQLVSRERHGELRKSLENWSDFSISWQNAVMIEKWSIPIVGDVKMHGHSRFRLSQDVELSRHQAHDSRDIARMAICCQKSRALCTRRHRLCPKSAPADRLLEVYSISNHPSIHLIQMNTESFPLFWFYTHGVSTTHLSVVWWGYGDICSLNTFAQSNVEPKVLKVLGGARL